MVLVRFERGRDDQTGPVLGPFEWVQLTYNALRVAPNGEQLASYDPVQHDWFIEANPRVPHTMLLTVDELGEPWSDIIIDPIMPGGHPLT
jgi:hypothetical protein